MIEIYTARHRKYIEMVAGVLGIWKNDTEVLFSFKKRLDGDVAGHCWGDKDLIYIDIATHVDGEKVEKDEMLQCIAHEMVHARQFIRGHLKDMPASITAGKNGPIVKFAKKWKGTMHIDTPYTKQPWEIEAYNLEVKTMQLALIAMKM